MTRINVVPASELSKEHLIAEYRELPRIYKASEKYFKNGEKNPIPTEYVLGTGHMTFFYNKLLFISKRHSDLIKEMKTRGYSPKYDATPPDIEVPDRYWGDYEVTEDALILNRKRIDERTKKEGV